MLRTAGPEVYDQWVTHEIPFNDPKVAAALERGRRLPQERQVRQRWYGDVKSIASTTFQDGGLPILDGPCAMHRQAHFYSNSRRPTIGPDGDVFAFYLPAIDDRAGRSCSVAASSHRLRRSSRGAGVPGLAVDRGLREHPGQDQQLDHREPGPAARQRADPVAADRADGAAGPGYRRSGSTPPT